MAVTDFNFELFFELSPDLLCIAGYDGYFKRINPAVSDLLGYSMEELYATPIQNFIYHEDRNITSQTRTAITKSKPLINFENRYITKSGEMVWLSWTSLKVESDQLIFAIAKNITHKKKVETERNALLADLTRINKDLKQLTYTTSHDLRSPVGNVLSILNLIEMSKISDEETLELIGILKLAGANLKETLDKYVDVLNEKHNVDANVEQVNFDESLNKVLRSISTLVQNSKVTIRSDFSAVSSVKFNHAYMESVFLNLITNSIKYARPGYSPVISIYSEKLDEVNRMIYIDNGMGFDMEQVKNKIFGLNQKFHSHSDSKGIGLYLVYNHITSLGGQISVESKVNEGTKFLITFGN